MKVSQWHALSARMVLVGLCAVAAGAICAETDKVTLVTKEVKQGRITKDDKDGLEIELADGRGGRGALIPITSAAISDVDWDVSAEGFHDAVMSFRRGAFGAAADSLQAIIDQKELMDQVRLVARPYVYYLFAECKYRGGKMGEAMTAYQKLISTFPASRYVALAITNMADSAIQAKTFDKLAPLLVILRDGGNDSKQLADYFEGESLFAQNKPAEAAKKYSNAATGLVARVKAMALVGQARCNMIANDSAKAREAAQSALALTPPEGVAASAHSILGDAIVADADSKKLGGAQLADALTDAVLEYMRVQNQYATDARSEAYALFKAGECFKRLAKLPGRTAGEDQSRAVMNFSRLSSERRFAATEFANKASKQLDEMR
ncbi:MAG: tetratricopeptide repeat protein [Planctomycetota bacterium]